MNGERILDIDLSLLFKHASGSASNFSMAENSGAGGKKKSAGGATSENKVTGGAASCASKYFERQDLFLFETKNRLCFFGMTDEPFSCGTFANSNMRKFYKKIAASGVGLIVTGGANPKSSTNRRFILDYSSREAEAAREFLSEIHGFGTKIFFKINSCYGRADREHLAFNLFPMSASRLKSSYKANLPCLRASDGKINKLAKEMVKMAKFGIKCGFDGLVFDDTLYCLMGELSSPEMNQRKLGYYSEYADFSTEILNEIKCISKTTNIFFEVSLKSFLAKIYGSTAKKIGTLKGIAPADDEAILLYLEKLVSLGVTGFIFKLGTHETEFLTEFNSLSGKMALENLYKIVDEYFEKKGILNKFGKKVVLCYHDNFDLDEPNELLKNENFMFDITRLLLANENYLAEFKNKIRRSCIACTHCEEAAKVGKISCLINPSLMFFEEDKVLDKSVAVVGGGISGVTTAIFSAERGGKVDLFEKSNMLCSRLFSEQIFGYDEKLANYSKYLLGEIDKLKAKGKVNLHLEKEFLAKVDAERYDAVVVATGSHEYNLSAPGAVLKNVKSIFDALLDENEIRNKKNIVIMVSGEISLKFALYLLLIGKNVSLVIERPEELFLLPKSKLEFYLFALSRQRAKVYVFAKLKRIEADFVELLISNRVQKEDFRAVILNFFAKKRYKSEVKAKCLDMDLLLFEPSKKPNNMLLYDLVNEDYLGKIFVAGDAMKTGSLYDSILSAFYISKNI